MQPIAQSEAVAWKRKVLADWMKHGHPEEELRRLAKLPLAQCLQPIGQAKPKVSAHQTRGRRH